MLSKYANVENRKMMAYILIIQLLFYMNLINREKDIINNLHIELGFGFAIKKLKRSDQ